MDNDSFPLMFHTKHEVKCLYVSAVYLTRQRKIVNSLLMKLQSEWMASLRLTTCHCTHMTLEGASVCMHVCVCVREGLGLGPVEPWALWDMVMEDGTLPLPTTSHWSLLPPVGCGWSRECGSMICCGCLPTSLLLCVIPGSSWAFWGLGSCPQLVLGWLALLHLVPLAMGDKTVASLFFLRG